MLLSPSFRQEKNDSLIFCILQIQINTLFCGNKKMIGMNRTLKTRKGRENVPKHSTYTLAYDLDFEHTK
uniref:Uncharacterized protein n=1 Tax=Meloidogyne enterolobii TaxID=390850 RepID=A0A6V7U0L1_MELEN|nr:unnamed protein product [Meloidogyne enterolobii]